MTSVVPSNSLKHRAAGVLKRSVPEVFFFIQYYRSMRKLGNSYDKNIRQFNELLTTTADKRCLQIGVSTTGRNSAPIGSVLISTTRVNSSTTTTTSMI